MTTFDEAECLKTNPFEGDFGSPGDKVLKDKIGTARKGGTCGVSPGAMGSVALVEQGE